MSATKLSEHFSAEELQCPCCRGLVVVPSFVDFLESVRKSYNRPMRISSAYRCEKHNRAVGGSVTSAHLSGRAVDVVVDSSLERIELIKAATRHDVRGLGLAKNFIHLDTLPSRTAAWFY